jgi:hypothetical protein
MRRVGERLAANRVTLDIAGGEVSGLLGPSIGLFDREALLTRWQ